MKNIITVLIFCVLSATCSCQQNKRGNNNTKAPAVQATALVKAQPSRWEATVSNGYKGDKITFIVSADGKRVENVEFVGYWQNKDRTIEELKNLDPPDPFIINDGSFGGVQQVPKSRMWWEFTGKFITPTTAEGTYRCAFAGGQNDTYKLKWTAKKIGG